MSAGILPVVLSFLFWNFALAGMTFECKLDATVENETSSATIAISPIIDNREHLERGQLLPDSIIDGPLGSTLKKCIASHLARKHKVIRERRERESQFEILVSIEKFHIDRTLNPLYLPAFFCGFFPTFLLEDRIEVCTAVKVRIKETMTARILDDRILVSNEQGRCASNSGILGYKRTYPTIRECSEKIVFKVADFVNKTIESSANFVIASSNNNKGGRLSPKTLIAVMDFDGDALPLTAATALTDRFRTDLMSYASYRVIERDKMALILKEQGLKQSGACTDRECLVMIGQLMSVQRIITGTIAKLGKIFLLNVREIDVSTGEVVSSVSMDCPSKLEDLPMALRKLAKGLAR